MREEVGVWGLRVRMVVWMDRAVRREVCGRGRRGISGFRGGGGALGERTDGGSKSFDGPSGVGYES